MTSEENCGSVVQREAYADAADVHSDILGLTPRDNRNHRKKLDLILDATSAEPGDAVLEVGCGGGLHTAAYAERFDTTAVDLSPSLVRTARQRAPSASVCEMDATDLAFADDTFDAVVGTAILHHLAEPGAALREWCRVASKSVTLMEPNYLFPKAFASTHLAAEERHKWNMAPWRLRRFLDDLPHDWRVEHRIYTPPWPEAATGLFDRIDDACRRLPGARRFSQMLLIQIDLSTRRDSRRS